MPQVGGVGKRILAWAKRRSVLSVLPTLLTATEHPCIVPQYTLPRSATMPMGRDPLTSRATANSWIPLVTAKRSFLRGAGSGALPALIRNFAFRQFKMGGHSELSPPVRARFAAIRGGRRATHAAGKCRGRMAADLPGGVEDDQRAGSAGSAGAVSVPAGGQR